MTLNRKPVAFPAFDAPDCRGCGKPMQELQTVWACEECGIFEYQDVEREADLGNA